ncbi:MAG: undecaprenyldiphospho-muramoylpentapeptide beta-N-acetylglucosaminyltransferase [Myxococcales bacterium]|jgi:UDP-N-acetylglucosamine--N-acetylmuramyl-(pentapeptide) pyrophosphoryl-undecaprenol N-acetylglucosamine transferase|nr:undecaprenyldiphospho-muramoylpentapeptide beta-N-acetylglucosaminyltransferase [Myxococcales bacterium]
MKLLIAGGGTGGHLFPGIALAEELLTRQPGMNDVLFVGTTRGIEARCVPEAGMKIEFIDVRALKGRGLFERLGALFMIPRALFQSLRILRRYQPDVVVGVGGYASGPVVLAARLLGLPTAIQEQNALPGMTNRWLGRLAQDVFTAFPEAAPFFPESKVRLIGNPIRRAFLDNYLATPSRHEKTGLLIFGGSQGAHVLNTTALAALRALPDEQRAALAIVHQTGAHDLEEVRAGYAEAGIEAEVVEFIHDMSKAYERADLVVCRAGATSLAELTVAKKASILVPFAAAADNHQEVNAGSLVKAGAAVMVRESELTPERLAQEITALLDPARRATMEKAASHLGHPEAAHDLIDVLVERVEARRTAKSSK